MVSLDFPHYWRAEVLSAPLLIGPARQYVYPMQIAGEEDALARGALLVQVHPNGNPTFLATCALGFTNPSMPSGLWACPNPQELCAVAGGYAYIIDTATPQQSTHISLKPVAEVLALPAENLLIFVGFHSILAWGKSGQAWQTQRLSWEGIRISGAQNGTLQGFGWDMRTDKEVAFSVDLQTGTHTGGGFPLSPQP